MRKNLFITLAVLTGLAIAITACMLGEDIETLRKKAFEANPIKISIAAIEGVTAPTIGGVPVDSITENKQYKGTVTWTPAVSGTFAENTQYTAIITLRGKTRYSLQGVAADFFTVAGATAANSANSGVIYARFPPAVAFALGATGPGGGKIFYYSAAGFTMTDNDQVCYHLEAAPADMPASLAWATSGYNYTYISGTGTAIGAGRKNTALILATDANAPAAKACKDYNGGGKTDWFLPSMDELYELYKNRASVGNMSTNWYWSSSQDTNNYAWHQSFSAGNQSYYFKNYPSSVRAVRAF